MSNSAYLRRVQPVANEEFNVHTLKHSDGNGGGGDMEQRLAVLEAKVSHIESDVTELKNTVAVVDKNTAVILERLDGIKESLAKNHLLTLLIKKSQKPKSLK